METHTVVHTGVPGLDEILRGGLPSNRMYLIQGNPGTGKTTLALQFLLEGVRSGESGMYVTFSESKEELLAVAHSHGISLEGISILDLTLTQPQNDADANYTMFHPSEVELSDTTRAVLEEVEKAEPQRIVFDSLSDMRLLAEAPLRYRRQILGLKRFFSGRYSTVLLLDELPGENDDLVESLVHGVIALDHTAPGYGGPRRRLLIKKLRGVNFIGGYHDMSIERGGIVIYPRLIAAQHHSAVGVMPFASGISELDVLTGGGLHFGTTTLIMGPAGTGKSIIAGRYVLTAAEKGLKPAYFAFDEVKGTILARLTGVGMDLQGCLDSDKCILRQVDPAELMPGEFSGAIREVVERGTKVVVIDSLNGFYHSMPEERFLNAHMHELLAYLNQQGVLTLLVLTQQGMFSSNMPLLVDLSYLADAILLLRYFEFAGQIKQAISVVKKRTGSHERTLREFQIGSDGIHVGSPLTQFSGVLTGTPQFAGGSDKMMNQ